MQLPKQNLTCFKLARYDVTKIVELQLQLRGLERKWLDQIQLHKCTQAVIWSLGFTGFKQSGLCVSSRNTSLLILDKRSARLYLYSLRQNGSKWWKRDLSRKFNIFMTDESQWHPWPLQRSLNLNLLIVICLTVFCDMRKYCKKHVLTCVQTYHIKTSTLCRADILSWHFLFGKFQETKHHSQKGDN